NSNGIVINKKNNIYYISRGKAKKVEKLSNYILYGRIIPKKISPMQKITVIVPSYYIDLTKIEWMIKKFYLSSNAYIYNYRKYHVLFITDNVENIKKALAFIDLMDVPTMKHKYTSIIGLKYIDVESFMKRLKELLPASGVNIANDLNDLGILIKPIPELNSLLLVSDKKKWISLVDFWKRKLDIIDVDSESPQIFIYKPRNRNAKDLANIINKLFTDIKLSPVSKKKSKQKTQKTTTNKFKVINDEERNRLIIYTTPKKYKEIYKMVKKLDVLPKQVLIQVTIAEITLKDALQYGFEWFLQHQGATNYSIGTLGNLGIGSGGLIGSVINSDQTFQSIMNFLAQKNLINILSSPKLLVLDNQTASINVGTQVPVLSSSTKSTNTDTGSTQLTQSVEYRNTGIILNVKPTIHSNGVLSLKISQTVSDPQPNSTSDISSPMILNRTLNTNVILKSNQALLLGGLIKQTVGKTINKVPVLGDIPILGNLFKTVSYSKDKTELIILVKPIIINNEKDGDDVTKSFQKLILNN
ncbi:MAG: hypothetical protein GXO49_07850, partial [Chlorobi bacterium]|nr:hypothetical protein [Chlorobiota bacterium]